MECKKKKNSRFDQRNIYCSSLTATCIDSERLTSG